MVHEKHIPINLFLRAEGHHLGAWRYPHPAVQPERTFDPEYAMNVARTAERGLLDSIFMADAPSIGTHQWNHTMNPGEPITMLSALSVVTKHIGLVGTVSTTYSEPYNLARQMAWLDHLSHGRAGWNVVTTATLDAAYNFGYDSPPDHGRRYERAAEYVEVVIKLWDSWEEEALVADKESGMIVDESRLHRIDHKGEFFSVRGPLNVQRPPQGHPVLFQAGSSEVGMGFAASFADAVFTSQHTIEDAQQFASQLRSLVAAKGRSPDQVRILPGLSPILGSTEEEARALEDELHRLSIPVMPLKLISSFVGVDLSAYDLDAPFPIADIPPLEQLQAHRSRAELMIQTAVGGDMTIRDLVKWYEGGRGHRVFVGTPDQLADDIEHWVDAGAADGFNLMPSLIPNGLDVFVDEVVPILQSRGRFRREYQEGATLRDIYGLPKPASSITGR